MLDGENFWIGTPSRAMAGRDGPESDVSKRLVQLRAALGFDTQTAFAAFVGLDLKRYSNFENDLPLSRDAALTLVRKISGLSLDWLYLGREDALSIALASRLRGVVAKSEEKAKTGP